MSTYLLHLYSVHPGDECRLMELADLVGEFRYIREDGHGLILAIQSDQTIGTCAAIIRDAVRDLPPPEPGKSFILKRMVMFDAQSGKGGRYEFDGKSGWPMIPFVT